MLEFVFALLRGAKLLHFASQTVTFFPFLTTLMSWMSCSPTVTTTGSLKWFTGRTTLL